jgi:hypothetical protein
LLRPAGQATGRQRGNGDAGGAIRQFGGPGERTPMAPSDEVSGKAGR